MGSMNSNATPELSVVIAVFNEAESVEQLYSTLSTVMRSLGRSYEILFVDDGSQDSTLEVLKSKLSSDPCVKIIELTTNFGQIAAFSAGFTYATGRIVITLDGDLQNDPTDIPKLLQKIDEGYMVVGGIRVKRQDSLARRVISFFVNNTQQALTGVRLEDSGCSIKAYTRPIVDGMKDTRGVVRFNALLAFKLAKKTIEIPVAHHVRRHGRGKWTFLSNVRYFLASVISGSQMPSKLAIVAGTIGFVYGAIFYLAFILGITKNVLAASAPALVMLGGFLIALLGVLLASTVRIIDEVQGRPVFVVRRIWSGNIEDFDTVEVHNGRVATATARYVKSSTSSV